MADEGNGTSIRFTTKELLQQVNEKLDKIDEKLDAKADKVVVDQVIRRVDDLERRGVRGDEIIEQRSEIKRLAGLVDVNLPRFQELQHQFKTQQATIALHNEWMRARDAVKEESTSSFSRNEKLVGLFFALITIILNILALAPDIIH